VPAEHFAKSVTVNVTGVGWDLIRLRVGLKAQQAIIPLERPAEVRKIVATTLVPLLASQVGNLKINFVVTDTLRLQVDKRDSHHYKLTADVSGVTFREGYGRTSPVVVLPASVKLEGPESRLHALIDSILLKVDGKNINENFRDEVEISFVGSEFVKRDPPVAQVMFEVGQITTVTKKLKVTTDLPNKRLAQDSVEATFQIPLHRIDDFNSQLNEITSSVRVKNLLKQKKLIPKLSNVPSYALVLKIDSLRLN
jgi:hypothetical protein